MKEFLKVVGLSVLIGSWLTIAGSHSHELGFIAYTLIIAPPYLVITHLVQEYFDPKFRGKDRLWFLIRGAVKVLFNSKKNIEWVEVNDPDFGAYLIKKIK